MNRHALTSFAPSSTMSARGRPSRGSKYLSDRVPLTRSASLSGFGVWPSGLSVLLKYIRMKATTSPAGLRHCAFQTNDWVAGGGGAFTCVLQPTRRDDGLIALIDSRGSGFQPAFSSFPRISAITAKAG